MGRHGARVVLTGAALGAAVALAGACTRLDGAAAAQPGDLADYMPLGPGTSWIYRVSDQRGRSRDLVTRVEGRAAWTGGLPGEVLRVRSELLDGSVLRWEGRVGGGVGCAQEETRDAAGLVTMEEAYDPPATIIDERPPRLVAGAAWSETFMDTTPNYHGHPKSRPVVVKWTVESVDDRLTVPAGTFTCIRLIEARKHRQRRTFWYAKGVGLVKEVGAGPLGDQTLELVRATLPASPTARHSTRKGISMDVTGVPSSPSSSLAVNTKSVSWAVAFSK